jgi:hypothetical protein
MPIQGYGKVQPRGALIFQSEKRSRIDQRIGAHLNGNIITAKFALFS